MVLAVKDSVKKSIDWLKNTDPAANQIAKRFTGLDLVGFVCTAFLCYF